MRLGNILTKKFLISFVCVVFTAIISLCGANLVNTYLMDTTSGYQETVTDDDESSGNGEENVQAEAEGYWSVMSVPSVTYPPALPCAVRIESKPFILLWPSSRILFPWNRSLQSFPASGSSLPPRILQR